MIEYSIAFLKRFSLLGFLSYKALSISRLTLRESLSVFVLSLVLVVLLALVPVLHLNIHQVSQLY